MSEDYSVVVAVGSKLRVQQLKSALSTPAGQIVLRDHISYIGISYIGEMRLRFASNAETR